jgi:hypothetical protein
MEGQNSVARIGLLSISDRTIDGEASVTSAPQAMSRNAGYFRTQSRSGATTPGESRTFLSASGQGKVTVRPTPKGPWSAAAYAAWSLR